HLAQGAALLEQLAERPVPRQRPGIHGLDELVAADEVVLQGQDAEQQVAVGAHGWGLRGGRIMAHGATLHGLRTRINADQKSDKCCLIRADPCPWSACRRPACHPFFTPPPRSPPPSAPTAPACSSRRGRCCRCTSRRCRPAT